jgi:hypoxanthine phosphoribosyltransferase
MASAEDSGRLGGSVFARARVVYSPAGIVPIPLQSSLMSHLRVLISSEQIHARIQELGAQIDREHAGEPVYLIAILKGAFIFLADLARAMKTPARIEFIGISSYGKGKTSSGEVRLTKDLDVSIEGQHVILVEDIVDTGITLTYLIKLMSQRKPKSLKIATLLDKPERRQRPVEVQYVGFRIPDEFVVGYGLDYAEDYRNLKDVCVLED